MSTEPADCTPPSGTGRPVTIGFVGIGRMGGPMARRLLDAGLDVIAFDLNPVLLTELARAGAGTASSLREVGDQADLVLVSLPTPPVVHAAITGTDGVAAGSRVRCVVDLSTTGPAMSRRIAAHLSDTRVGFVDAPVSGGVRGAAEGKLAVMIAGPDEAVLLAEPVLRRLGVVFRVGSQAGLGQSMKLLNNYLSATALAATAEAFVVGAKAGLSPQAMVDVVNASSGRNSATQDKFPRSVLPGTFDFGFAIGLLCKDLRLFADEAEALGVPLFAGASMRQLWELAREEQGVDADFTEIIRPLERWAGVEVRSAPGA